MEMNRFNNFYNFQIKILGFYNSNLDKIYIIDYTTNNDVYTKISKPI